MPGGARSADTAVSRGSAGDRAGERGFILLDVVLALAVLALMVRIVWPMMPFDTTPARQTAYAHQIATLIEADRIAAARRGQPVTTRIDVSSRVFVGGARGWTLTLPRDVDLEVSTTADCMLDSDRFAVDFAPDGRSCGLAVRLARGGRVVAVTVNWLTGFVEVTGGGRGRG